MGWVPTTTVSSLRWTERNGNIRKNGDIHTVCPILVYSSRTRPRPLCSCRQTSSRCTPRTSLQGDSKTVSLQYGFVNNSIHWPWRGGGVSSINNSNDAMRLTPLTSISDSDGICWMLCTTAQRQIHIYGICGGMLVHLIYRLCGAYTRGGISRETFLGPRLDDFVVIGPLLWVPYPWIKSCGRRRLHSFAHQPPTMMSVSTVNSKICDASVNGALMAY